MEVEPEEPKSCDCDQRADVAAQQQRLADVYIIIYSYIWAEHFQ